MNYNDDDREPIVLKKEKKYFGFNNYKILTLLIVLAVLAVLLIVVLLNSGKDNLTSLANDVEVSLHLSDVKVTGEDTSCLKNDSIQDADNVRITYKKSESKFYYGEQKLNDQGLLPEEKEEDMEYGVDLVIHGITNNIYVYVEYSDGEEDYDSLKYTFDKTDNGNVFIPFNAYDVTNVSVYIYSSAEGCNSIIKHYDVILPRYNKLSTNPKCNTAAGKESNYCMQYVYNKFDDSVLNKIETEKTKKVSFDIPSLVVISLIFIVAGVFIYVKLR